MKDVCEFCQLNHPTGGCTRLSHESCLKEAVKLIKLSVSNGEILEQLFDAKVICKWDLEESSGILVHMGNRDVVLDREWFYRPWSD